MKVTVIGCGRWASFHAWYQSTVLENETLIWGRGTEKSFANLSKTRKNAYLELPETVRFTSDLDKAVGHADHIIIAISAQGMEDFSDNLAKTNPKNKTFILCMKGIMEETGDRLSEVLARKIDKSNNIVVWVGPGHVQDFLTGQPNIMIVAGTNPDAVAAVAGKFKSSLIRFYESADIVGCEVGAAAKNVIGITAGMLDGAGLFSLKGALMARGVYEVANLIVAMGGEQLTAYGISHIGDFEATLFSQNSNNRRYGEVFYLAHSCGAGCGHCHCGKIDFLAEGVATSKALKFLANKYKVEMPISNLCYQILHEGKDPNEGLRELFMRDNAKEFRF